MKFKIILLLLLISIKANCQLVSVERFYSKKWNDKNDDKSITIYNIKGKKYTADRQSYFSSERGIIYQYTTTDVIHFMLYNKRYLFIGHFIETPEQGMSGLSYELRLLVKLDVIDLEDSKKKWTYQFNKKTSLRNIKSFNPKDGDIIYCNNIKPEKNSKE